MGLTNSVHPYCKFATQAIQMTPMISCTHGFASADVDVDVGEFGFALIIVLLYCLERTRKFDRRTLFGKVWRTTLGQSKGVGPRACMHVRCIHSVRPPQHVSNPEFELVPARYFYRGIPYMIEFLSVKRHPNALGEPACIGQQML